MNQFVKLCGPHIISIAIIFGSSCKDVHAQTFEVSTNLLPFINSGTTEIGLGWNISDKTSLRSELTYTPELQFGLNNNRYRSAMIGARINLRPKLWLQTGIVAHEYSEETRKGQLQEGDSFASTAGIGYSFDLPFNFRLDTGAFIWSGYRTYTSYFCTHCGSVLTNKKEVFILPHKFSLSITKPFGGK